MDSTEERRRGAGPAANDAGAEARIEPAPDHAEEDLAEIVDDAVPTRSYAMLPMVGLGGSAGGIAALQAFFEATPAETGLAFVVVMHLAADHESMLAPILQRATRMPVQQVRDSARVEANHVYVIPPGKTIASANGYLQCTDITHGPRAAAIVLSGADGDGAIGIKRIKERGGLTIAQDPDEAEHAGMPRAAIATGMIDWVLRAAEMPARVGRYHDLLARLKLPP
jgi:two-component system CheB/CheR fusion protein